MISNIGDTFGLAAIVLLIVKYFLDKRSTNSVIENTDAETEHTKADTVETIRDMYSKMLKDTIEGMDSLKLDNSSLHTELGLIRDKLNACEVRDFNNSLRIKQLESLHNE